VNKILFEPSQDLPLVDKNGEPKDKVHAQL